MYLCYADESGYSGTNHSSNQPVQVMAAILTNVYNFHRSDSEFHEVFRIIQSKIPISELKGEQIYRGKGKWRDVPAETRDKVIEHYIEWIKSRKHKFIITAIDNEEYFKLRNQSPESILIQKIPYPYLLAGLHTALVIQKIHRNKEKNKGKTLLIFDEQSEFETQLAELIFTPPDFIDEFVEYSEKEEKFRLCQIIDTAFFVKSHYSSMAQVVDIIAYLFRLYLELHYYQIPEAYSGEKEKITEWINKIKDKFIPFNFVYPQGKKPFIKFLNSVKAKGII